MVSCTLFAEVKMRLADLANKMMTRASMMACIPQPSIDAEDIESLKRWRDMIAQGLSPDCSAVHQLNEAIKFATSDFAQQPESEARAQVVTVLVAVMIAAAAGALLEAVHKTDNKSQDADAR
jgi:hypothetical protein